MHEWRCGKVPHNFDGMFDYASNIHNYDTRYASKQNLYKPKVKTSTCKQAVSFKLIDLWKELSTPRRTLTLELLLFFINQQKDHLLSSQRE